MLVVIALPSPLPQGIEQAKGAGWRSKGQPSKGHWSHTHTHLSSAETLKETLLLASSARVKRTMPWARGELVAVVSTPAGETASIRTPAWVECIHRDFREGRHYWATQWCAPMTSFASMAVVVALWTTYRCAGHQ